MDFNLDDYGNALKQHLEEERERELQKYMWRTPLLTTSIINVNPYTRLLHYRGDVVDNPEKVRKNKLKLLL